MAIGINIKDEVIKATIAAVTAALGAAVSAFATAAINKHYARDDKVMDVAKAKSLIKKLEGVSDLSMKQAIKLERAMKTVLNADVEQIKINVISAIIISPCQDKDNAIVDVEHRLTVRGPVTRGTLDAQKQWLENEVDGINRAYNISVPVTLSI